MEDWSGRGSLAANLVTKAADMKESQQGTVGFLFFILAKTHWGSAKSLVSSPTDKDFIVQRCDSLSIYMYSPLAALNSLTLLFSPNSPSRCGWYSLCSVCSSPLPFIRLSIGSIISSTHSASAARCKAPRWISNTFCVILMGGFLSKGVTSGETGSKTRFQDATWCRTRCSWRRRGWGSQNVF